MGILNALQGNKIYLDTNIFIYAIEGYPDYVTSLETLFDSVDAGDLAVFTSELTLAEVLVKPMQEADLDKQKVYNDALQDSDGLTVVNVSREVLVEAAKIRANQRLKLPDAIHLATAIHSQCTTFLTNDSLFAGTSNLPIVILSEAIASNS